MIAEKTIMIVEDEPVQRFVVEKLIKLSGMGYDMLSFAGAAEAIHYINTCVRERLAIPKFILLDLLMPEMDGFDFLAALNQPAFATVRGQTNVIVVTISGSLERHRAALKLGARAVLSKPLKLEALQHAMHTAPENGG